MPFDQGFGWCRRAFMILALLLAAAGAARAGTDQWTTSGPFGGVVSVLAVDPENPTTVYAGNAGGGLFKSTDGGASWARASNGLSDLSVKSLVIDPQNSAILYAGTDQGGGLFKSTDSGASWTNLQSVAGVVNLVAIDPTTPSTLYVGETQSGLFKSTDGGITFNPLITGLPASDTFVTVIVDPQTPATLYAADSSSGIFKSTNGGSSWSAADTGLTGSNIDVQALVINPQAPANLYAAIAAVQGTSGLFRSTNGGASWTLVNSQFSSQIGNGFRLAINPQTPTTLYAGLFGVGAEVSTNGGASFSAINNGLPNFAGVGFLALAVNPQSPGTVYAGTQVGLFATANAGGAWTAADNGLSLSAVMAVAVDPLTPTTIYAGTSGSGVFKSADGGATWAMVNAGLSLQGLVVDVLAIDPVTSTNLYATGNNGGVFKTTNGGASWTESDSGLPEFVPITDIAIDPSAPSSLYVGTSDDGVFKSTNGGASWAAANNGLPAGESIVNLSIVGAVPAQNLPSILLASTVSDGTFTSSDGGNTWISQNITLPGGSAVVSELRQVVPQALPPCKNTVIRADIAMKNKDLDTFNDLIQEYISCATGLSPIQSAGLALTAHPAPQLQQSVGDGQVPASSTLTATPWGPVDGAYLDVCEPLGPLLVNPQNSATFYAGGGCGVLIGTNSGAQVVSMSLGLPPGLIVNALGITPNASDLYAGTAAGVYRFTFAPSMLAAAVLPASRSVETGIVATAFASIVNGGNATATSCGLAPSTSLPADFFFQTTDPKTNSLTGTRNTAVDIPAGQAQSFVFGYTPSAAFNPIDAQLDFSCSGLPPVAVLPGVNTLLISGSATPVPDDIALVATVSNDGILHIMGTSGSGAFALATDNVGASAAVTVMPGASNASLPLSLAICQTNPSTGQCLAAPTPSVTTTINSGDQPTFGIFGTASGAIPFEPAGTRIFVRFIDANGAIRGSTSVAVETE